MLDLYLPVYSEAIEKTFSKDYDVSRLVAWLRSDGRRFLENASLIVYDAAVRGRVLGKNNGFDVDLINRPRPGSRAAWFGPQTGGRDVQTSRAPGTK